MLSWGQVEAVILNWTRREAKPVNTVRPSILGALEVDAALVALPGVWSGNPTLYRYQWFADGVLIAAATASTLLLISADVGKTITVRVIGHNGFGDGAAVFSLGVGPVLDTTPSLDFSDEDNSMYEPIL